MNSNRSRRSRILRDIANACMLEGQFKLRSGATSGEYFDKYQFEARPELLWPLSGWMADLLDADTDLLGGLELGGIPLATAMALGTGIPAVFVRKAAKTYGTCRAIEGPAVDGKHVVVIEDVVTTGGQILESAALLRNAGAVVKTAICALWRGTDFAPFEHAGIELRFVLTPADLIRS